MNQKILVAMAILLSATAVQAETIAISTAKLDKFRGLLLQSINQSAASKPGLTVLVANAEGDRNIQIEQARKFAEQSTQKIDALIVIPSDGDVGPSISEIGEKAGIPLVFVNTVPSNLSDLPESQVLVASNEKEAGTLQGEEVCRQLKGKGKAVLLMGEPFHSAARTRTEDIDAVLARPDCNGITVVERQSGYWSRDFAEQQMREWLKAGVSFDAVIANNDEMAIGAINALKQAGRSAGDVVIAGIDANSDALAAMSAGDLRITVLQNANEQGKVAMEAALKLAARQKVSRENYIPFELITQKNLSQYLPKSQ